MDLVIRPTVALTASFYLTGLVTGWTARGFRMHQVWSPHILPGISSIYFGIRLNKFHVCFALRLLSPGTDFFKITLTMPLTNQGKQTVIFNPSEEKQRALTFARFPALSTGCMFSHAWDRLHVFHAGHWVDVFPRLAPVTSFPACYTGCTGFPALGTATHFCVLFGLFRYLPGRLL